MKIGIPKEIKNNENRVGLPPSAVMVLVSDGHKVFVECDAGVGSHFTDEDYEEAGATIVNSANKAWDAQLVVKVKEPQQEEFQYLTEDLILFTYLHLANEPELAQALVENKVTAIAYETVQLANNSLPLLTPMSEIAGRMSVQVGAHFLEKAEGYLWLSTQEDPVSLAPDKVFETRETLITLGRDESAVWATPDLFEDLGAWGSFYPNHDTYPPSDCVRGLRAHGVSEQTIANVMGENAARVFAIDLKARQPAG